jgi:peroxiredoxin family protein
MDVGFFNGPSLPGLRASYHKFTTFPARDTVASPWGGRVANRSPRGYDDRMTGEEGAPVRRPAAAPGAGRLVVLLHRGAWEDRYQAVTLAVTAAAFGERVMLALFFQPLALWAQGRFDEGAPATATAARVAPLRETVEEARRHLDLEVVACDTAVRLAGLDPDRLGGVVDRIVPLPEIWSAAREGSQVVI